MPHKSGIGIGNIFLETSIRMSIFVILKPYNMKFAVCLFTSLLAIASNNTGYAQNPRAEIQKDKHFAAANYLAYPDPGKPNLAKAPNGYKPFYISTYARHGSRYHIAPSTYASPLKILQQADSAGILSTTGKEVLEKIARIQRNSDGRLGELTPLGARQHQGIAERMYRNFPEIFAEDIDIDARSTVVIRCILSMEAECQKLQALNPNLQIRNDASQHDMFYMNYNNDTLITTSANAKAKNLTAYKQKHIKPDRLMTVLFNDPQAAAQSGIDAAKLMYELFEVAINMQSHDEKDLDFLDIFTADECYDLWSCHNVHWYLSSGDTPLTAHRMPYREANLLRNILDTADTCIVRDKPYATMRFGHESCLLPLAALMELGNCGYVTDNLESLADNWQCQRYFPMASNIQLIFYRKPGSTDILVRALLNEKEVTMPVSSDCAPFYHWADVERYYRQKLDRNPLLL